MLRSYRAEILVAAALAGACHRAPHEATRAPCPTRIPPIELRYGDPSTEATCRLVVALKREIARSPSRWNGVVAADSDRIRAINVLRTNVKTLDGTAVDHRTGADTGATHWVTDIEADIPGVPRLLISAWEEGPDTIAFYGVHHGGL